MIIVDNYCISYINDRSMLFELIFFLTEEDKDKDDHVAWSGFYGKESSSED